MNSYDVYEEPEGEISPVDVLWDLLAQWKVVLLVALVCAAAAPCLKYVLDGRAYASARAAQEEAKAEDASDPTPEDWEAALEDLSSSERETVERWAQQQALVDAQKRYLEDSVMLHVDLTNVRRLVITYVVQAAEGTDIQTLGNAYGAYFRDDAPFLAIGQALGLDADVIYLRELASFGLATPAFAEATSSVLNVTVTMPEEDTDAQPVRQTVDALLQRAQKSLAESAGAHTLDFVESIETHNYDSGWIGSKMSTITNINTTQTAIDTAVAALTEDQQMAFKALTAMQRASEDDKETDADEEDEVLDADGNVVEPPHVSLKFSLVGFVVGVVLYAMAYMAWVIMRKRVTSVDDLQLYSASRSLGDVYFPQEVTGLRRLLHSKMVERRRYRSRGDVETQVGKAVANIESACEHLEARKVTLLCVECADGPTGEIATGIARQLEDAGLGTRVVPVGDEVDEKVLLDVRHALVVAGGQTKAPDVWQLAKLCGSYDVQRIGCVYIRAW